MATDEGIVETEAVEGEEKVEVDLLVHVRAMREFSVEESLSEGIQMPPSFLGATVDLRPVDLAQILRDDPWRHDSLRPVHVLARSHSFNNSFPRDKGRTWLLHVGHRVEKEELRVGERRHLQCLGPPSPSQSRVSSPSSPR